MPDAAPGPFDGLVVLELASVLAGPSVGQFFAELGATVWKVENPATGGDVTRRWTLPDETAGDGCSAYFAAANWGKQSLALDLSQPEGQRVLHDLARAADVVVASYKPGDAEKLGADAPTLCALNPRLIVAQIVGYAEDDPRAGYDAVLQAECGFTFMNGTPDGPPVKMPVALVDVLAAHQVKEAVLVRLWERERTGRGGVVTVSLLQSGIAALVNQASNWLTAGHVPQRMGSDHPNIAPYGTLFPTADGSAIVLAVGTDRQFAALCDVLNLDLADAERFATNAARVRHRDLLHTALAPRIAQFDRGDLLAALAARHVPAGAVRDLPTVFEHPAAEAMVLRDGALAAARHVAFSAGDEPTRTLAPPPRFGAGTRRVLIETLGYSEDEVTRLARTGVVGEE